MKGYENHLNKLILNSTYSMGEDWLIEKIKNGFSDFGEELAVEYAHSDKATIYEISLLIKAGLRGIKKNVLSRFLESPSEDEQYDAALSLAIYGHSKGFDILKEIIDGYPKNYSMNPQHDILPDLKYIHHPEARKLEQYIITSFDSFTSDKND